MTLSTLLNLQCDLKRITAKKARNLNLISAMKTWQKPRWQKITIFVDHPWEWKTTGAVTPLEKFVETAALLIFHSLSAKFDKKVAVKVTEATESPDTIRNNSRNARFFVVTPEQSMLIKPEDTAFLSMVLMGDPGLTSYQNKRLWTGKPEYPSNTVWFPTPEIPGQTEDHTPIQTQNFKKLNKINEEE